MRFTKLVLACAIVAAMAAGAALAQEGHPLKGSWLGDWGPGKTPRTPVLVVMDWDGKAITGMINPGTDNIPLKNATLTPPPPPPPAPARGAGGGGNQGGGGGNQGGGGGGNQGGGGGGGGRAGGGNRGGGGGGAGQGAGGGAGLGTQIPAPTPGAAAAPAVPPLPKDWFVHFEGDTKAGVHYVVDGKIINVGVANRSIEGTWMVGTTKNDFRIVRQ
jgi:hypothetical protein